MVSLVGSDNPSSVIDKCLWGLVFALLLCAVAGNYYFSHISLLLRVVGFILLGGFAIGVDLVQTYLLP